MRQLLLGHPGAALDHNVLLAIIVPAALLGYLYWTARRLGLMRRSLQLPDRSSAGVTLFLVLFTVVRNLPLPSLLWLRSGP